MSDVLLKVKFTRGTHPHERKFWIAAPDGGSYVGLADISHCFDARQEPLEPLDLGGQTQDGYVAAVLVTRRGERLKVSVPDGSVCEVEPGIALKPATQYVPL